MYNHNKQGMRTPGGMNAVKYRNGRFDTERSDGPRSESPRFQLVIFRLRRQRIILSVPIP